MSILKTPAHNLLIVALLFQLFPSLAPTQTVATSKEIAIGPDFNVPHQSDFVPGEIVVRYIATEGPGITAASAEAPEGLSREQTLSGGAVVFRIEAVTGLMAEMGALGTTDEGIKHREALQNRIRELTLKQAEDLNALEYIEYAEPNYILYPMAKVPDDPFFSRQWHYFVNGNGTGESPGGVGLPAAWDSVIGNPAIVVAVIDTGILPNHEDISVSNLLQGFDFITDPWRANDGNGRDNDPTDAGDAVRAGDCGNGRPSRDRNDSWHGTHVSGTVGVGGTNNTLGIAGVNWSAKILPVRVLGRCGGTFADIADAIRWAAGVPDPLLPPNPDPAKIINMSLGGFGSCGQTMQRAIDDAYNSGTVVVVAAGNEGDDAARYNPANCNHVVTVAASDMNGHLADRYSNFGPVVDIMAPGGDVRQRFISTLPGSGGILSMVNGGYAFYNGTSMAAPHVAGVAALLLASKQNPIIVTPDAIQAELEALALPRDSSHGCPTNRCGKGLLSAIAAGERIAISPATVSLNEGDDEPVSITLTSSGQPVAGAQVNLSIGDARIAAVVPSTGVTDAAGVISATVHGSIEGDTTLNVQSLGGSHASASINVSASKVPGLPLWLVGLAVGFVLLVAWLRRKNEPRGRNPI